MMPLKQVMGEYLLLLARLATARENWKQNPSHENLVTYLAALNATQNRRRHADIIRTIEFPDVRKTAA